jgi:GMC oxidoreductase
VHAVLATSAVGTNEVGPNHGFSIRLGLLRPKSRGRIKITSADPTAPLLIDPKYLSVEADVTSLCAAVEHSRDIGSAAGLSEWHKREIARIPRGKREMNEFVERNVGSYWHPVGTCAMGKHEEAVQPGSNRSEYRICRSTSSVALGSACSRRFAYTASPVITNASPDSNPSLGRLPGQPRPQRDLLLPCSPSVGRWRRWAAHPASPALVTPTFVV